MNNNKIGFKDINNMLKDNMQLYSYLSLSIGCCILFFYFRSLRFFPSFNFSSLLGVFYAVTVIGLCILLFFVLIHFLFLYFIEMQVRNIRDSKLIIITFCLAVVALLSFILLESFIKSKMDVSLFIILYMCSCVVLYYLYNLYNKFYNKEVSDVFYKQIIYSLFLLICIILFLAILFSIFIKTYILSGTGDNEDFFWRILLILFLLFIVIDYFISKDKNIKDKVYVLIIFIFLFYLASNLHKVFPKLVIKSLGLGDLVATIVIDEKLCFEINAVADGICQLKENGVGVLEHFKIASNIGEELLLVAEVDGVEREFVLRREKVIFLERIKDKN